MMTRLAAHIILATPLAAMAANTAPPAQHLDISGVTAIRVIGEASSIALTTIKGDPMEATLGGQRFGWFSTLYSSWFYNDCREGSRMSIEGGTLVVDVNTSTWLGPSDCRIELKANLPPGTAVVVDQVASQVKLLGEYSALTLRSKTSDISFDGHASSVQVQGDELRSHLTFARTEGDESIAISARSLDAHLDFLPGTHISYEVSAIASLVDSALSNDAGAKPSITINGDYVRATIR